MRRSFARGMALILLAGTPLVARAQGYGRGETAGYGISPSVPYSGGSTVYLPSGMGGGGFVPYTAGPGGGLGVQARMTPSRAASPTGGMGGMATLGPSALGRPRGAIVPLAPIIRRGAGMGARPMIRRTSSAGRMNRMARPPVGGYPFRQPPSLIGPTTSGPAMSM